MHSTHDDLLPHAVKRRINIYDVVGPFEYTFLSRQRREFELKIRFALGSSRQPGVVACLPLILGLDHYYLGRGSM
jgi:hypothetical protein